MQITNKLYKLRFMLLLVLLLALSLASGCGAQGEQEEGFDDIGDQFGEQHDDSEEHLHEDDFGLDIDQYLIPEGEEVTSFMHVHGLSFNPQNDREVYLSTHFGLVLINLETGIWTAVGPLAERHDMMGFTFLNDTTMITSGHPALTSLLLDPLGVMVSHNYGQSWEELALHGVADFHVFHVNQNHPDFLYGVHMYGEEAGLHISSNGGLSWDKRDADFVEDWGLVFALTSHQEIPLHILLGYADGIYESQDGGVTWAQTNNVLTFVSMEPIKGMPGEYYAYLIGEQQGLKYTPDLGGNWIDMNLDLGDDVVLHIAINPNNHDELLVGTYEESIYYTSDRGETWQQLAVNGEKQSN